MEVEKKQLTWEKVEEERRMWRRRRSRRWRSSRCRRRRRERKSSRGKACVENFDIIAVTETWIDINSKNFLSEFKIEGYELFHEDRKGRWERRWISSFAGCNFLPNSANFSRKEFPLSANWALNTHARKRSPGLSQGERQFSDLVAEWCAHNEGTRA